jgi:hypothetical protein
LNAIALASALLLLLLLTFGSAYGEESGPQWTVSPWVKGDMSNNSHPSTNLSTLVLSDFNISGHEPSMVILGKTSVPFREYQSCVRSTELWLESGTNWTQYSEIRQGQSRKLIAYTPSGGDSDLYLIDYANSTILHKGYHLHPGYRGITFRADKIGRTMVVLTVENQPSNALVIDVLPPIEVAKGPRDIEQFSPGYALVTITSDRIKGYDVYMDGVFYSSDTADGVLDGTANFRVGGDSIHTITISKGGRFGSPEYSSEHTKSFQSGYHYLLTI